MNLLKFLICFIGVVAQFYVHAQEHEIVIKCTAEKNDPAPSVTIYLSWLQDSTKNYHAVTDSNGIANISVKEIGQFVLTTASLTFEPLQTVINTEKKDFLFVLTPSKNTLESVTVSSNRPLMRQEEDKTIIEPANIAAASTNAYEILEKTPGLFTDQDGNIYIASTTPATILINGREMKMSASDIATMLKNLPPTAVVRMEVLRTPSAKYDASGSGGVVNIILKKGVKIGLTGSASLGMNQGRYGNQFSNLNLNNNNGATTSYLNLSASHRKTYDEINTSRVFAADTLLQQNALTLYPALNYYMGAGISYEWSSKWQISYDARLSYNSFENLTTNLNTIKKQADDFILSNNENSVSNDGHSFNINNSINLKYKIDTLGSEWTTDLSYNYNKGRTMQGYNTLFELPVLPEQAGGGIIENNRHFGAAQIDLKLKFKHKYTLETGFKSTVQQFNNTTDFSFINQDVSIKDDFRTSAFRYDENINAAYIQGTKTINDIIIKAGVRLENTNMRGNQLVPLDTNFTIHRSDFFPYIFLSKKIMKIAGYEIRGYLVYRKSITRPVYEYLNPFPRFIDAYLFETGNPLLRPQFTQNFEANISVDETPLLAVGINNTRDIFTNVIYQADSNATIAYRTWDNLGANKETYIRALGAIPPGGKYFFVIGAQYNHNNYKGLYENKPLEFQRGSWTLFTYHTLKLGKLSVASLSGFVRFNGQLQFYELGNFGQMNMSVNRQFMQKKLTVTLNVTDLFFTNNNTFTIQQGSINAFGNRLSDTKRFGINLRYNFGLNKKEEKKNMFESSEGE